jgi:predicted LPLAT superfamily acyltransferase
VINEWKAQPERSAPWVVALIVWIALNLGRVVAHALLWPIVAYFFLTSRYARRQSRRYLARVLPVPVRHRDVFRHIHTFAACALDRVYFLSGRHRALSVTLHDPDGAIEQVDGHGGLVFTAHLGSFEALRTVGATRKQLRFRIVIDRAQGAIVSGVLDRLNPALAREQIDSAGGPQLVLALHQALGERSIVGLMADRRVGSDPGIAVDFLGGTAYLPSGPWKFAAALGAPVVLCFGLYRGGNAYELHFERFADAQAVPRAQRAAYAATTAQRFATRLEHYVRLAPYNWFNFYDFWPDAPAAAETAPPAATPGCQN